MKKSWRWEVILDRAALTAALVSLAVLFIWTAVSPQTLQQGYLSEQGLVERSSALAFLLAGGLAGLHARTLGRQGKEWWVWAVWVALALLLVFVAGEEVSWGQRWFGWQTPEGYPNEQGETNIHNLRLGSWSLKSIFEAVAVGCTAVYLTIGPYLAARLEGESPARDLPLPSWVHGLVGATVFLAVNLLHPEGLWGGGEGRGVAEVSEFTGSMIALSVILRARRRDLWSL